MSSIKLKMGVIDQYYTTPPGRYIKTKGGKKKFRASKARNKAPVTTTQVANWLESKYHVMEIYLTLHSKQVQSFVDKALLGAARNLIISGRMAANPLAGAEQKITADFKAFLSNREIERIGYPGIPTKAALRGKSSRFKLGYALDRAGNRTRRPSFIDTGLYQASAKAWFEIKS